MLPVKRKRSCLHPKGAQANKRRRPIPVTDGGTAAGEPLRLPPECPGKNALLSKGTSNRTNRKIAAVFTAAIFTIGGDEEDRTLDLTDANRTLSQLSYAPILPAKPAMKKLVGIEGLEPATSCV